MRLLITAAFAAALTASLHAQDVHVTATIPFDFHACNRVMPSGKYAIRSVASALLLSEEGPSGARCLAVPHSAYDPAGPQPAKLVFRRYGSDYFLGTIWGGYSANGKELPVEPKEKALLAQRKRNGPGPTMLALTAK
jgi:hypothetical protein